MIEWLLWLLYSLVPAGVTILAALDLKIMTVLYFVAVAVALVFWYIRDRIRAKHPDTI